MLERHRADGPLHRTGRRASASGGARVQGDERANGSSRSDAPLVPLHEQYRCPLPECGGTLYLDQRPNPWTGGLEWFYHCFACAQHYTPAQFNEQLRANGVWPNRLKRGDFSALGTPLGARPHRSRIEPPSLATVEGWHSALLSGGDPLRYLTDRRGLTLDTLRAYKVGWDRDRGDLTFPAIERGRVVYLYWRKPVDGAHVIAMGGRRPPYPDLPPDGPLCLVAGELDALTGRQIGLRAVTVSGCSLPDPVAPQFTGRVVYVMFDRGEELAAENVADKLRGVGATAHVVRLSVLRLPPKFDLNDLYRKCGEHTAQIVKNLIRAERNRRAA